MPFFGLQSPKIFPIFIHVNLHTSYINLYDVAAMGILFTGLNFAFLLGFTKKINRSYLRHRYTVAAAAFVGIWPAYIFLCIEIYPRRFKCPTSTQTPVSVPLTYPKCKLISGPGCSPETGNN